MEDKTVSGYTKDELLSPEILAYCGYKLEGNKLVPIAYNPIPYDFEIKEEDNFMR